jgi:TM2 domain-containing membrane protein YozV
MKKSIKGALLSGLVFPGLGQIVLRRYKSGIAFVLITLAGLVLIIMKAVQQALIVVEKIESMDGSINMSTISNAAIQVTTTYDRHVFILTLL